MKIHEITEFAPPSGFKSYKPRKRRDYSLRITLVLVVVGVVIVLALNALVDSVIPQKAHAEVKTAKDCMTNECVIEIVCAGHSGYVNEKEICSN